MAGKSGRKRNFVRMAPGQTLDGCSRVRLGTSVLDLGTLEMTRDGRSVTLRPLPLRLLLFLLRNRDRTVSREEILSSLWQGSEVSDYAFSSALRDLRSALGDSGSQQGAVRTLRNRGYRYVGPVELEGADGRSAPNPAPSTTHLFGREPELRALKVILDKTLAGTAHLVLIDGVPGIGKSSLLEKFLGAVGDGIPVMHARCVKRDWTPPGALLELLVGPSVSKQTSEPRQLANRLQEIASQGSFVLGIDDIDRADLFSLSALRELALSDRLRRCLIVATRSTDPEHDQDFEAFIRGMPLHRFRLEGLETLAIQRLAREIGLPPVDPAAVEAVRSRTEGHPVLARALLRSAFTGLGRSPEPDEIWRLPVPEEMRQLLERRLERCSRAARRTLVALASKSREADHEALLTDLGLPSDRLPAVLGELERAGLLKRQYDGLLGVESPLLRDELGGKTGGDDGETPQA